MEFPVGMRVIMNNPDPRWGMGHIKVGDVGIVVRHMNSYLEVDFPDQDDWMATPHDLIPFDNQEE